jgi:hypothetical protein
MNPLTLIPDAVRKGIYVAYASLGVLIGAVQVGYVAINAAQPDALTIALAVYAYVGVALGLTAASNVQSSSDDA